MGDWPPDKADRFTDSHGDERVIYLWRTDGKVRIRRVRQGPPRTQLATSLGPTVAWSLAVARSDAPVGRSVTEEEDHIDSKPLDAAEQRVRARAHPLASLPLARNRKYRDSSYSASSSLNGSDQNSRA